MVHFWFVRFVAFFHALDLASHVMSAPIIESYKPKVSRRNNTDIKERKEIRKMLKNLEHRIDEADVRQRIMEAQKNFPLAFMGRKGKMMAALRQVYYGTPSIIYLNIIISTRNGILLQIFDDGTVNGTTDFESPWARLTVESVGPFGLIRIKGTLSQKYLIYKNNGQVVAETLVGTDSNIDESIFSQITPPNTTFVSIRSEKYRWYLGFRGSRREYTKFKLKKGPHVKVHHKGSQFIIRSL